MTSTCEKSQTRGSLLTCFETCIALESHCWCPWRAHYFWRALTCLWMRLWVFLHPEKKEVCWYLWRASYFPESFNMPWNEVMNVFSHVQYVSASPALTVLNAIILIYTHDKIMKHSKVALSSTIRLRLWKDLLTLKRSADVETSLLCFILGAHSCLFRAACKDVYDAIT